MPQTKIKGLESADNGNEFLCFNCIHGSKRSGTNKELQVFCSNSSYENRGGYSVVPFPVTQCDQFKHKDIVTQYSVPAGFKKQAWYLDNRETVKGKKNPTFNKLIDSQTAVEAKLISEFYLED